MQVVFLTNSIRWFLTHRLPAAEVARAEYGSVCVVAPPHETSSALESRGFEFEPLHEWPQPGGLNPAAEYRAVAEIGRTFKRLRPGLVHSVTMRPVLYGGYVARKLGIPAVSTVSGLGSVYIDASAKGAFARAGILRAYRYALKGDQSMTIVQNADDYELFLRKRVVQPSQLRLIRGSGVSLTGFPFSIEPGGVLTVTFVGRLIADKGIREFVEACRIARSHGIAMRVLIVGDYAPMNPSAVTQAEMERWIHEDGVEWIPYTNTMPEIYRASNIVVLPSYREGLPKVLIEAGAVGRAVITTDAPGCREVVDGKNGILVPVKDVPLLAAAIERLARDRDLRIRMGSVGRKRVEAEFSSDSVVKETMSVYSQVLAGRRAQADE